MKLQFPNGSKIQCYGLNKPEYLCGQRFTAIYHDETASESEAALMVQVTAFMAQMERPEPLMPKPRFGLWSNTRLYVILPRL